MENCEPLGPFGAIVLLLTVGLIMIPYLRGKGNLISAWNLLLLGIFIFVGLGSFDAVLSPNRFHNLEWFSPTPSQVNWFIVANSLFLLVLVVAHRYDPIPPKVCTLLFSKWPPITVPVVFYVLLACAFTMLAHVLFTQAVFLSQIFMNLSHKAAVFAAVFSFVLWYRNRRSLLWLGLFVAVFCSAGFYSMLAGGGRRLLLSVLLGPVLYVYMEQARHWKPMKGAVVVTGAALALFVCTLMYSSIRHYDMGKNTEGRTASGLIRQLEGLANTQWADQFLKDQLQFMSQQAVHYALLTHYYIDTGELRPQYLNTVKFVLAYPIPRTLWPKKPLALGIVIVTDAVRYQGYTNWGCGISGQAVYEGGLLVIALYGYLAAFGVRLFDVPLQRQPTNPFLVAMLAAASAHILAWPRGDLGIMTNESLECILFAWVLGAGGRFLFGTDRSTQGIPVNAAYLRRFAQYSG